ncbi:MAG: hypothetical protein DWQ44_00570 [Bacteroidetes bacterium]|nr:MAG: hypothetical protein DWQ33_03945 [Bacteroidota bacterium]REK07562.1 MAG: hypothetical protein DWQ39_01325 [Bacteroidota bacterium]REK37005.1 MAG: hypothetical protein DWQ44_00570 [Bacteroidota bacterium]REK47826.1 MAG: hypothetical protein DWQ48_11630 [Bacteroidota bacterium]
MATTDVVKLNEQVIETWNRHDTDKFLALCDESIVWTINKGPETFKGKQQVKEYFENWRNAFPDLNIRIRNTVSNADQISVEYEFTGTHKGDLRTRPDMPEINPTNKRVTAYGCYTARVKGGKLAEVNNYPDRLGLIDQLGVLESLHQSVH